MSEDKILDRMSIISSKDYIVEEYPNCFTDADLICEYKPKPSFDAVPARSPQRYAKPYGFWTLEVFYKDCIPLIPKEVIECMQEPSLNQDDQVLHHEFQNFYIPGKPYWSPVTVVYNSLDVGAWLIDNHEDLQLVHHATGELTYWIGQEKADRIWDLKDWRVIDFTINSSKSSILTINLTFIFSEAVLSIC